MKNIICILVVLNMLISGYCGAASIGGWLMGGNIGESDITLTYQTTITNRGNIQWNGLNGFVNASYGGKNNIDFGNSTISFYVGQGPYVNYPNGSLANTLLADIDICVKGNDFKICGKLNNNESQLTSIVATGTPSNGNATVEINISNIRLKSPFGFDKLNIESSVFIAFRDANNNNMVVLSKNVGKEIKASQASYGATLTASSIIKLTANGSASEYATLNCTEHPAKVTLNTSIAKNRLLIDGTPMKEYSMTCTAPKMHRLSVEPLRTAPIGKTTEMINMTLIYP